MAGTHPFTQARNFLQAHRNDYTAAYTGFEWPKLDRFNWALDHFDPMAEGNDTLALWIVDEDGSENRLSYAQMARRSSQVANFLRGLGVRRGDHVLLLLPNEVALWETMLACIKLGAVIVPTTTLVSADDLADRFERGNIRHVVASHTAVAKFAGFTQHFTRLCVGHGSGCMASGWLDYDASTQAADTFTPDGFTLASDPLLLYFTSGTTSRPKLVMHSHQSYPVGHLSTMYWIGLQAGDLHWNISSPGWAKHAWSCFFAPWNAGATVFIYNYARFDGPRVLATLVRCQVTSLCAPPTVWRLLIQQDLAAHKVALRELVGAGEPLNPEVIEQVRHAWGLTIRDGFGQSETTALVGNSPGQPVKAGSMGRPLPGYRVVLLDADDRPADEGELTIELAARPLGLMLGYQNDEGKMGEVMRAGHYRTGDVATRDAEGFITYVGRADDVFKAAGYRISPFELESVLIEHPAVAEAAVVPSPDPVRGNVPKAFVALRAGFAPSKALAGEILGFARERLAPYKRIRGLEFFDLPKTLSGKIRRVELRRLEASRGPDERAAMGFVEDDFIAGRPHPST
jgi:acetyl-CoA synthetase